MARPAGLHDCRTSWPPLEIRRGRNADRATSYGSPFLGVKRIPAGAPVACRPLPQAAPEERHGPLTTQTSPPGPGSGQRSGATGLGLAALTFALFSGIDALVKWMSLRYPVLQVTFYTTVFALVPVAGIVMATGGIAGLKPRRPGLVILRAVLLALDTALVYYAFNRLPLADVYAMVFTSPLLVTALSVPLLGERVGWRRWSAIVVGFIGVLIILRPGFAALDLGHFAALGSAILFALSLIVLRRVGREESSGALLLALMLALIAIAAPAMPFMHRTPSLADLAIFAAAGLVIGLAQLVLVLAVRKAPAASVAPFQYTQMIWAVIFGLLVFGDRPHAFMLAGSLVIVAGGLYVFFREMRLRGR